MRENRGIEERPKLPLSTVRVIVTCLFLFFFLGYFLVNVFLFFFPLINVVFKSVGFGFIFLLFTPIFKVNRSFFFLFLVSGFLFLK